MYQRDCPHHGISEIELLNIFYDGVAWEYKSTLDAASNGNFMTHFVFDGTNLINNLAESCSDMNAEFKSNEVSYVNGQMSKQGCNFNYMKPQDQVYPPPNKFFNANQDFRSVQGQYQGHYQPPFRSCQAPMPQYQAPYQPPKDNSHGELKSMMQMLLSNQQKLAIDINAKVDNMYKDLNSKFDTLSSHVKKLDTQVAQTAEAVRRQQGILPRRPEANPRVGHVNAITLTSDAPQLPHETTQKPTPNQHVYIPKIQYSMPPKRTYKTFEECNTVPLNKTPAKLDDPGKFVIPIKIGLTNFPTSLCDLGSSVNLMPHLTAQKLGFSKLEPTTASLMFADCSLRTPLGILIDVHVQVGHVVVPVDFVVLRMEEDPGDPLILGRPFLRTTGAKIDVRKRLIELNFGTNVLNFQMDKDVEMKTSSGDTSAQIYEPPWRTRKAKLNASADRRLFITERHFSDPP